MTTLILGFHWVIYKIYQTNRVFSIHSRGQHLCKFIATKESVCIRKEFNSQRIGLGHQRGRRSGRCDVCIQIFAIMMNLMSFMIKSMKWRKILLQKGVNDLSWKCIWKSERNRWKHNIGYLLPLICTDIMNDYYKEYFNVIKNTKVDTIGDLKKSTCNVTYI